MKEEITFEPIASTSCDYEQTIEITASDYPQSNYRNIKREKLDYEPFIPTTITAKMKSKKHQDLLIALIEELGGDYTEL